MVHRLSSTHLPPLPSSVQPVTPPLPGTFAMNLCQRTQGCMKNENHTGFCSGHRGFKRKNTAGTGEEGATGGQRRKSGGKGKGRGGVGLCPSCAPSYPLRCWPVFVWRCTSILITLLAWQLSLHKHLYNYMQKQLSRYVAMMVDGRCEHCS